MTDNNYESDNAETIDDKGNVDWRVIRWAVAVTVAAVIIIVVVSVLIVDQSARINFLTVSILSVLTLVVVAVGAHTSREATRIMSNQEREMNLQRQITQKQLLAMQQDLEQTREFFEASERPAVGITKLEWKLLSDDRGQISIVITNTGRSPAKNLIYNHSETICAARDLQDLHEPEPYIKIKKPDRPAVLQIGGVSTRISIIQEASTVLSGEYKVFIWVYVTYEDLRGKDYRFEGYFEFVPMVSQFRTCTTHNDID